MNDHPVHRDDITAMNTQGDLKAYMRSLIRPTNTPTTNTTPTKRWAAIPKPPNHQPGAWPPGTQPPGPPPDWDQPAEAWADAVRRYRTETRRQLDEEPTE